MKRISFLKVKGLPVWLLLTPCAVFSQQVWTAQAPGPNTQGQVENIDDGEVVGAINTVAVHPTNPNIIYAGAVNGGIWRTSDGMAAVPTWDCQTDHQKSLSIGALEFDPTDTTNRTLVAGTGCFSSFGSCGGDARSGLLRTTDDGATWTAIDGGETLNGLNISGVAPRGSTIVISVNAADDPRRSGVWRSSNTGGSWTQVSGGSGTGLPGGPSYDLASDPSDPSRLFTNAGTQGLYRSTDTGATWSKVSDIVMDGLIASARNIKFSVAIDHTVYVAIVNDGRLEGVFLSGDGGARWTPMDLPMTVESGRLAYGAHPGAQGGIHLSIAADRNNSRLVYIGGDRQPCFTESFGCNHDTIPPWPNSIGAMDFSGRLFRGDASKPAGRQWVTLTHSRTLGGIGGGTAHGSAPHADSRDMAIIANGVLIEVDDGGIYQRKSPQTNSGDWFSINGNVQATEFHAVAWDANSHIVIGGAQDTGTPSQQLRSNVRWRSVSTGDGGDVAVDDLSSPGVSTRYSSSQYLGNFQREVYDSANMRHSQIFPSLRVLGTGTPIEPKFYTPIKLNTITPARLIIGAQNSVYESQDQGDTITEITPSITVNDTGPNIIAYGASGNPDIIYAGSGARVFVRTSPSPAPLIPSTAYHGGPVLGIAIDPHHPETAYVIDSNRVFRTTDSGAMWTDLTGNLPSLAQGVLRSVAFSTSTPAGSIVVGSDTGVFEATGGAFSSWSQLGAGLPRVPVYHLEYSAADRVLLAGTLGRGAWTLTFPPIQSPAIPRADIAEPPRLSVAAEKNQHPSQERTSGSQVPSNRNVFKLRSGVIIDPAQHRVYIMSPSGGIDALELATGGKIWSTKAASKPLGLVNQRLISQAESAGTANKMKLVILNPSTGTLKADSNVALPAGVQPAIQPVDGQFDAAATASGGEAIVTWEFQARPLRGLRPGTEDRLSSPRGVPSPSPSAEVGAHSRSGAFRLNLATGSTSAFHEIGDDSVQENQPALLLAPDRLPGLPETQVLSADGQHIMVSNRTADDRVWEKYTLTLYERGTGKRLGEFKSHLSMVPFFVTGTSVVFETGAYVRKAEAGLIEEPLKIRAIDLETGHEIWSRQVRDTAYHGSYPP